VALEGSRAAQVLLEFLFASIARALKQNWCEAFLFYQTLLWVYLHALLVPQELKQVIVYVLWQLSFVHVCKAKAIEYMIFTFEVKLAIRSQHQLVLVFVHLDLGVGAFGHVDEEKGNVDFVLEFLGVVVERGLHVAPDQLLNGDFLLDGLEKQVLLFGEPLQNLLFTQQQLILGLASHLFLPVALLAR